MRLFVSSAFAVSALGLLTLAMPVGAAAQSSSAAKAGAKAPAKPEEVAQVRQLPVHKVILYKNGVGYFEHLGSVAGNQHVAIDFTSSQLNDVLQSLTILDDNGGRIGGVNYNSTTPLAEQLKSLSLAMSDDPNSTELFQALRGQRVEVSGAPGGAITGRLMSIETKPQVGGSDTDTQTPVVTREKTYLTVIASSGAVRLIEVTPALSVRPLDPNLQGQLDRYLELLASTRSTGLRHLTLDAMGVGPRQLRVSYISEVPVWKSTYRLVFAADAPNDSTAKAILQGWAVVDNTIGSDWDNVQLSLVAGSPQSFIQPLSQPLYLRRPEVPISTTAMTTPQTHEATEEKAPGPPAPAVSFGVRGEAVDASQTVTVDLASVNKGIVGMGSGSGGGIGAAGGVVGSVYGTGRNVGGGTYRVSDAMKQGDVNTQTFDDFFQYTLAQAVTIHKNESAMVPILQENLPAERVTLWSKSEATPFRAIWLENTSKLTFDRGSFSIFEGGVFAGQGLLDPIHPGEKRLLSYAADQAIHVRIHPEEFKRQLRQIRTVAPSVIELRYGVQSRTTYIASNSAEEPRTVILEVPRQANRELSPESKATETTPGLYRFRLSVAEHQSASLLFADEGLDSESIRLEPDSDETAALEEIVKDAPEVAEKFKPLIAAQRAISDSKTKMEALTQTRATLTADEARDRENLTALKGNEGAKRFVDELNRTEDAIEANRQQSEALEAKLKVAVESLREIFQSFHIEWQSSNWNAPPK